MQFTIIEPIGEAGGYGQVYKCMDEYSNVYALKELINNDAFSVSRFEREMRLMSRLNHPNVIKLIAYNLSSEHPKYVMPLYHCSLISVIPTLVGDYRRQFSIINSILSGVSYLHSEGVLHRDLKPGNILWNTDSDLVITDFGFGIQKNSDSRTLTSLGWAFGTPRYCSPEQRSDSHNVDERTDIYAIGMIIEDIVTNFGHLTVTDPGIKYIIDRCTRHNREDRFESIAMLSHAVTDVYNILLGRAGSQEISALILQLTDNTLSPEEIASLALRLQALDDEAPTESFFSSIVPNAYTRFESECESLAKILVEKVCAYWNKIWWPYSDIDVIANTIRKIFTASSNADVKATLLYQLIDLSIRYNRWYAMGVAENLLTAIKNNSATQTALAIKLRANWLPVERVVSSPYNLPSTIYQLYLEHQ